MAWCGMIWAPYDWLNKIYSFYVETVVGIISRHGLSIDVCYRNQSNKSKVALYKPLIHYLKQLYISNRTKPCSYKDECGVRGCGICIKAFKIRTGLGYIDNWFWVISNIILLKTVIPPKELKNKAFLSLKQYCTV